MEQAIKDLADRIAAHCKAHNIAETTFGIRTVNDGKLISRLRNGRTVTMKTFAAIERELSAPKDDGTNV